MNQDHHDHQGDLCHQQPPPLERKIRLAISADLGKGSPALETAVRVLQDQQGPVHLVVAGGCGNKVLQLLLHRADIAVFNLQCSRWDTCATAAVLMAYGGNLTTFLGRPIEHSLRTDGQYTNSLGVIASTRGFGGVHASLCEALAKEKDVLWLDARDGTTQSQPIR
jgi:3'-phosphoadenosine 5'-phosphosulfate (PAPS) 3'-phosphatase